jgi:hypothetical protein
MSIASRLLAFIAKLPPAETYDVELDRDIAVPMPDGVTLRADRYYPRAGGKRPTVLVCSPYGRRGLFGCCALASLPSAASRCSSRACAARPTRMGSLTRCTRSAPTIWRPWPGSSGSSGSTAGSL